MIQINTIMKIFLTKRIDYKAQKINLRYQTPQRSMIVSTYEGNKSLYSLNYNDAAYIQY